MQDNLCDAWWRLTPPHIVELTPLQLTTEIGSVTTISCYANTHFSGLSVIEIVSYTHIIVHKRSTVMPYQYTSDAEILTYKRPPKLLS
jgi:hypothetical protein